MLKGVGVLSGTPPAIGAEDPEELAQDVFLQVYRAGTRYEPQARFTTWLYRIVTSW